VFKDIRVYRKLHIGQHPFHTFHIQNGLKQDDSAPLLFNFASEFAIRKVQENHMELKLSGTLQPLVYAAVNLLGRALIGTSKKKKTKETSIC
jgi:hypothetical protein